MERSEGPGLLGWLRVAYVATIFASVTLILLPMQLLALAFDHPLSRRLPRLWHRIMAPAIGLKIHVQGKPDRRRPLMLIANHASWVDILALGSVADVVFIAKAEVRGWPVFGALARLQRSVFVDREVRRSTTSQVADVAARLERGEIVVLFPEGTTSDGNRLLEFKSSLIGAAAATTLRHEGAVLLQPVAITYTRLHGLPMGRRLRPVLAWPGDVELAPHLLALIASGGADIDVSFGETIEFTDGHNRKLVTRTLRMEVHAMLTARLRGH